MSAEKAKFLRYDNARRVQSSLFDHTTGASTGYSQRLNGSVNEKFGLARSISVMPGDRLNIEVWAKYVDTNAGNLSAALATLISQISSGTAPGGTVMDGPGYGTSTATFPFAGKVNTAGSTGGPKAYLNYILFDRNFKQKTSGYQRLSATPRETGTAAPVDHERLFFENLTISEAGYIYIFLSNEETSIVEVFFDDFKVEHIKSPIVSAQDYYPFGLTFNSYQRENSTENRYLYNQGTGEKTFKTERVFDLGLNIDLTKYRAYDPALGRWWQVDPLADQGDLTSLTPFNYSFNNPVRYNDPEGDCPPGDPNCNGGSSFSSASSGQGLSIGALLAKAVSAATEILNFHFGDGNDGTTNSAAQMSEAHRTMQAVGVEAKEMRSEMEATFGQVPGLNVALEVQSASQAETTGDTMQHLGKAALNANSIPIVGGPKPNNPSTGTNFVVTPTGEAVVVPSGASGPSSPRSGSGMVYQGGQGGPGLNSRVTGVRIMDPKGGAKPAGQRVVYMNSEGQTVSPSTGRTVPNSDPNAHIRLKEY